MINLRNEEEMEKYLAEYLAGTVQQDVVLPGELVETDQVDIREVNIVWLKETTNV